MTRPSSCAMGDMKFTRSSDFKVGLLSTIPMAFSCCMCSNDITKNAFSSQSFIQIIFPLWLCCGKNMLKPFSLTGHLAEN